MLSIGLAQAEAGSRRLQVVEPYIQLHTGPGEGYPIFLDLQRGSWITVIKKNTDWFKVKTQHGKSGWVSRAQLEQTITQAGDKFKLADIAVKDFSKRDWEFGTMLGASNSSDVFTLFGAYVFNELLSVELAASQLIGVLSTSEMYNLSLVAQPFPGWMISPYFTVGTGLINTRPRSTLVQERDQEDQTSHMGLGVRAHLTRSFFLRAEYKEYVIFSSSNINEDVGIWSVGIGSFF